MKQLLKQIAKQLNPHLYRDLSFDTSSVLIVSEHYLPSTGATAQLITDLASGLHAAGVPIQVFTSTRGSSTYSSFPVFRFPSPFKNSFNILSKITNGFHFFAMCAITLSLYANKNQSILVVSNPPFIGVIGLLLYYLRGCKYIFLLQDIFPRSAVLTGVLPARGPILLIFRQLIRMVITNSEATIVLSDSMKNRVQADFAVDVPLYSIPNWSPTCRRAPSPRNNIISQEWGVSDCFTVQYSGNYGRLHDIITILESARQLQHHAISFCFVGGGAKHAQIEKYIQSYGLRNVFLKPYQPRSVLPSSLASCDLSIVSLVPGAEDTVAPSKLYGILAAARPVLLISSPNSEISQLIRSRDCGFSIGNGDVDELVRIIQYCQANPLVLAAMSVNARQLYLDNYGRELSLKKYIEVLRSHFVL